MMSDSTRTQAISAIASLPVGGASESAPVSIDYYGADVFSTEVMKKYLPKDTAKTLLATIQDGLPLNADIAAGACVPAMSVLTGKTLATRKSRRCYASAVSVFCAKYAQTKPVRPKNPSNLHFFNTVIAYTHDITSLRKMLWFSELPLPPRGQNSPVL